MNSSVKRCRQMTIMESFSNCKREKSKDAEPGTSSSSKEEMRELLAAAVEKRRASASENVVPDVSDNSSAETIVMSSDLISSNSDDLFPDIDLQDGSPEEVNSNTSPETVALKRWPECSATLPELKPSENHSIMFRPHLRDGSAPRPYPDEYRDKWDSLHVRMPCSPQNLYPHEGQDGDLKLKNRWDVICESLTMQMNTVADLENAIMRYNKQYIGKWDFRGLRSFFNEHVKPEYRTAFFNSLLPNIANLALQLPHLCTQPIPLLRKQENHTITLSQKQVSCLLANAFFCTFPRRNFSRRYVRCPSYSAQKVNHEYAHYPDINFNKLFSGTKTGICKRNKEKLKCLLNYFSRVTANEPTGTITFHRRYLQTFPNWASSCKKFKDVVVRSDGVIESEGYGMLQVDFANMFVGGGVLSQGCVQEEIRFVICPELIASMLFTECLGDSECLIITGVEQYNDYTGYGDSFTWNGDYPDDTPRDAWGRKYTQVVAIDALHFHKPEEQFKIPRIQRELNKALVGFYDDSVPYENLPAVATGNWGCGVYKGYPYLKFLIQLMAASQVGRGLLYFTFGDQKMKKDLQNMYSFMAQKGVTVGDIWALLEKYCTNIMSMPKEYRPLLYEYIYESHSKSNQASEDTTELHTDETDSLEAMWLDS